MAADPVARSNARNIIRLCRAHMQTLVKSNLHVVPNFTQALTNTWQDLATLPILLPACIGQVSCLLKQAILLCMALHDSLAELCTTHLTTALSYVCMISAPHQAIFKLGPHTKNRPKLFSVCAGWLSKNGALTRGAGPCHPADPSSGPCGHRHSCCCCSCTAHSFSWRCCSAFCLASSDVISRAASCTKSCVLSAAGFGVHHAR